MNMPDGQSSVRDGVSAGVNRRVLFVEDNPVFRDAIQQALEQHGIEVISASSLGEARAAFSQKAFEVVILDQGLPDGSGLSFLRELSEEASPPEVIVIAGVGDVPAAVEAIRLGAVDYLVKPFGVEEFLLKIDRAFVTVATRRKAAVIQSTSEKRGAVYSLTEGSSPQMKEVFRLIEVYSQAAPTPVLIQGETGVGKERVARSLHMSSARAGMSFVALNCATFDTPLIESELFGHERGAFTGAQDRKIGMMELAHGGTLFLDEIGDMPPGAQAKLLRAIENRSFRRVGGTKEIQSDFWLISATNQDFGKLIAANQFRSDLYYRLATLILKIPPLRNRREDIPGLVGHICAELLGKHAEKVTFRDDVLDAFENYSWPGNVRELRNIVERSLIIDKSYEISLPPGFPPEDMLAPAVPHKGEPGGAASGSLSFSRSARRASRTQVEAVELEAALREAGGNKAAAARALDIPVTTLKRLLKKHNISA